MDTTKRNRKKWTVKQQFFKVSELTTAGSYSTIEVTNDKQFFCVKVIGGAKTQLTAGIGTDDRAIDQTATVGDVKFTAIGNANANNLIRLFGSVGAFTEEQCVETGYLSEARQPLKVLTADLSGYVCIVVYILELSSTD